MYTDGIIIGILSFLFIGLFHPIVILGEYHFGIKIWPIFLLFGVILCIISLFIKNIIISSSLGVLGFCCFWSIHEIFQQQKRVKRGWFPKKIKKMADK
jgi:hypothetical protein